MCKLVKAYLKNNEIEFEEANAKEHLEYLISQGFNQTPILEIDNNLYFIGSLKTLEKILRQHQLIE